MAIRVRNAASASAKLASQAAEQVRAQVARAGGDRADGGPGVRARSIAASASCKPSGQPSVASCSRAQASASTRAPQARAHELDRLRERKAQRRHTDPHASSVGDEIRRVDVQLVPRGDDDAQVRRLVVQQVREDTAHRRGREALGVVDDQHDVQGGLHDLGEPGGGALQLVRGRRAVEQRLREGGPSASHPHRVHEALHEPPRVVGRVRRQPGDDRAAREMLAPPLGEERGLAEARGRLDDDQRAVAELRVAGGEPLADDEVPRRPRRGRP